MNSQYKRIGSIPDSPGVYFFKRKSKILYIGRATSLRDRVKSYFKDDLIDTRGPLLVDMLAKADSIEWQETDSVLEAIILESNLIKKHQPKYNTQEKDDRSYNYVIITDEDFPRIVLMRGRELEKLAVIEAQTGEPAIAIRKKFGPYPQGGLLREALSIIRKIFPFRDGRAGFKKSQQVSHNEAFYQSIGLSPDTSSPEAKKEYAKTVRNLVLFFEGKKKALIKALEREMKAYAKSRQFEKANRVKHTLYALGHIQDVSLIKKNFSEISFGAEISNGTANSITRDLSYSNDDGIFRIEAYDIAHLGGSENVGVMTVIENGELAKNEYRKFKISRNVNDDVGSLSEMLRRRMNHREWRMPDLIVVDCGQGQINAAEKIIAELRTTHTATAAGESIFPNISVVSVLKDDRHKARDIMQGNFEAGPVTLGALVQRHKSSILLANSEAHRFAITFHRKRLSKKMLGKNTD
jgi:excinuclease ABC subunit C